MSKQAAVAAVKREAGGHGVNVLRSQAWSRQAALKAWRDAAMTKATERAMERARVYAAVLG